MSVLGHLSTLVCDNLDLDWVGMERASEVSPTRRGNAGFQRVIAGMKAEESDGLRPWPLHLEEGRALLRQLRQERDNRVGHSHSHLPSPSHLGRPDDDFVLYGASIGHEEGGGGGGGEGGGQYGGEGGGGGEQYDDAGVSCDDVVDVVDVDVGGGGDGRYGLDDSITHSPSLIPEPLLPGTLLDADYALDMALYGGGKRVIPSPPKRLHR